MQREFSRADRVAEQMKREIAIILQRELKDPRVKMCTVSDVRVSGDLMYAKVYVTFLDNTPENVKIAIKVLNKAVGFVRTMVGKAMKLRVVPEIKFYHDSSLEKGMELSTLITKTIMKDNDMKKQFENESSGEN